MSKCLTPTSHPAPGCPSWETSIPELACSSCFQPCWFPADFVLVWEEDLRLGQQQDSATQDKRDTHRAWRETFLDNLRVAGLHVDQVQGLVVGRALGSASTRLGDRTTSQAQNCTRWPSPQVKCQPIVAHKLAHRSQSPSDSPENSGAIFSIQLSHLQR